MSSWVVCRCGERIGTGAFPNPNVGHVVLEEAFDQVQDPIDRKKFSIVFTEGAIIVFCKSCSRVMLRDVGSSEYRSYALEPEDSE